MSVLAVLHSIMMLNREIPYNSDLSNIQLPKLDNSTESFGSFFTLFLISVYTLYITIQMAQGNIRLGKRILLDTTIVYGTAAAVSFDYVGLWTLPVLAVTVSLMLRQLQVRHLSINNKAVLITGCDTGIGHSLAIHLDKLGLQVFAGCLQSSGPGSSHLVETCSKRLQIVQLDVSDLKQVDNALKIVQESLQANGTELWGIINNAGICYIGNVEMMTETDIQKIMNVNYLGPVNVCKYFLPLLRRSKGRLINVASNAGLAPVPLMGVYCASKSALATMTEVWRYELKMWGIKVATIIPSGYKTGIMSYDRQATGERWWQQASDTVKEDYGKECFYIQFKQKNHESFLSAEFSEIISNITHALLSTSPKPCYYSGFLAKSLPFIYLHLPTWASDPIMSVLVNWFDFKPQMLYQQRGGRHG